ncbi:N-acetyltransferase [Pseudonocardiaceae bacterium YIM PH 21723]|nr:N-acetyltransferase [Pseudonocardiaceae bacterium YIM PH 21723]
MRVQRLCRALWARLHPEHSGWPVTLRSMTGNGTSVLLRPPTSRDAARWVETVRADRDSLEPWWPTDGVPWEQRITDDAWRERCGRLLRSARRGFSLPFVIEADGRLAGEVHLDRVDRRHGTGEIGGWVGSSFRTGSVGTLAVRLLVRHAFEELGLIRLTGPVAVGNRPAAGLLERSGFRLEGVMRSYMHVGGELADHQLWSLLVDDQSEHFAWFCQGSGVSSDS